MIQDFPPEFTYLLKVILVGDSHTGKSCLLHRLVNGTFDENQDITIGVDFGTKYIPIQDEIIKFQIWDTAGQESFRSIIRSYYKNIAACLIVYDVCNRDSFDNVINWLIDVETNSCNQQRKVILVGNKVDSESQRQVSIQEGQQLAHERNLSFYECSGKTGVNVLKIFTDLANKIYEEVQNDSLKINSQSGIIRRNRTLSLNDKRTRWTWCCG
tara:strand:+ start:335 stop:973 length:639 start_codon:yes stop_codon:yes gene_type:complete